MMRKVIARKGKGLPVSTPPVPTSPEETDDATRRKGKKPQVQKSSTTPKEKKKRRGGDMYRSNLKGIIELMNEIQLEEVHIEALNKTPFWLLLDALRQKKIDYITCQKKYDFLDRLIGTYKSKQNFLIGKRNIRLTREEVKLILGIQCGEREMKFDYGSKQEVDFVKRRKLKGKRRKITPKEIKLFIKALVAKKKRTDEDIKDVAKLLCMFLCVTFLFSTTGNTVSWAHIQYLDDLEEMKNYDWADAVLQSLVQSIEKHPQTPRKVTGCVNLLLYWFCEHTQVIKTMESEEIPRLLKWNITDMQKKQQQNSFDEIQHDEVLAAAIKPTPIERALYGINSTEKNKEDAESLGSEDDVGSDNVGGSNGGGGSDNEDEDEEEEEEIEEEEENDKNQLSESQPELIVKLSDTPKQSLNIVKEPVLKPQETEIAKEPVLKSPETREEYQNLSSDHQTPASCPVETVVPETPILSANIEGLNPNEHAYATGLCTRIKLPSLHSRPSAGNKSQDDSLSVVELQKKLEVTEVEKKKIQEVLKEALAREEKLLQYKQEATQRVQELENILKEKDSPLLVKELRKQNEETKTTRKEALAWQEQLLKEKDGTSKTIEVLRKRLEQMEVQKENVLGVLKQTLERERRLLNDKHEATKRADELEKILNNKNTGSMEVQQLQIDVKLREAEEKIQNLLGEKVQDRLKIEKLEKEKAEKEEVAREEASASATRAQMQEEENTRLWEQVQLLAERNMEMETEMAVHVVTQKAQQEKSAREEKGKGQMKNSMFANVKTRKRKEIELGEYGYPLRIGKRQKEFEESMNVATDIPIKSPECPIRPKSKYYAIYNKLPRESKIKLAAFWKDVKNWHCLWGGDDFGLNIYPDDVHRILGGDELRTNIIDSYAEVLVRKQNMEPSYALLTPRGTCYAFTGHILRMIVDAGEDKVKRILDKAMKENKAKTNRNLLFPINHSKHWTLLVLDQTEGTWKFYNSTIPRRGGRDFHCEEAALMQKRINAYLRSENENLTHIKDNITKVKNSPQQSSDSLDCGVVVCYIIRQYVKNEQIQESISKEECNDLRAEILNTFLTYTVGTN